MMKKIKIILDGMVVPFLIYVGITFITLFTYESVGMISGTIDPTNPSTINSFFVQGIASAFIVVIFFPLYRRFKRIYEIKEDPFRVRKALYVIPLAFSICVIGNIVLMYMPVADDNGVTEQIFDTVEKYGMGVGLVMVAVLIPIVEEYIFRGFMFGSAYILKGEIFSIIFTSLVFAFVHMNLTQGIYAFFAGIFLGYVRYRYANLTYTMIMHLVMNASSIIFVPAITLLSGVRDKIFMVAICIVLAILSIYKINEYGEKKY